MALAVAGCGATAAATPKPSQTDLLKESGTSTSPQAPHVSAPFTAASGWTLSYAWDCSKSPDAPLFDLVVMGPGGTALADTGTQTAITGTNQAVMSVADVGMTLDVFAGRDCAWATIASH
jgi:hypothetical protein